MENMIKVKFTQEIYTKLSQLIFEKINSMHKELSHYQMVLTVPVSSENGEETVSSTQALEHIAMISFGMSKLATVLHSLESANDSLTPKNVLSSYTLQIDKESLIMLREFLTELLGEQTQKANDYMFKLQTVVQLGQKINKVTSIDAIDELSMAGHTINAYANLLYLIETSLKDHFMPENPVKVLN